MTCKRMAERFTTNINVAVIPTINQDLHH